MKLLHTHQWQSIGVTILVLISIACSQAVYDTSAQSYEAAKKDASIKLAEPAIPSVDTLKILSAGNISALADYYWISTIQYFGAGNPYQDYPSLGKLLQTITDLDPKFEAPYEFGLITLPFMHQADTAVSLGLKAQDQFPNNGLLTYYLATVYHLNLKDYTNAAFYYQKASKQDGAPSAALTLAGTALDKVDKSTSDRLVAAAFWESVYENAKTDDQKDIAKSWYQQMQIVYSLEVAAREYQVKFGHFPPTLQEMVTTGFVSAIPDSPVKRKMLYDPTTGKIDTSVPIDQ